MKTLKRITLVSLVFSGSLNLNAAWAEKMASHTQDLVIQKMERVLSVIDDSDPSWAPTQQRLADLLAERARDRFMLEVESKCDNCKGSKDDRKRAIQIYEVLLKKLNSQEHGLVLFQLAHLYEMAGHHDKAISLFEEIIANAKSKKIPTAILSRSQAALGDLLFQQNKFNEARKHYVNALKDRGIQNRALLTYNLAWCDFNAEKLNAAILTLEGLLKDKNQITRDTETGRAYDHAFHADILRDLATFYARKNIQDNEIHTFETLSPASNRKELMYHFASEADRLGQKQAAHKILNRYLSLPDLSKEERLEAFVRLAQVNYDRGQTKQSTQDFAKAAAAFKSTRCDDSDKCDEIKKTMKRYVTELHRTKKLKPDHDLLNAYLVYIKTFPRDLEMANRGAQTAVETANFPLAIQIYRDISENQSFTSKERQSALDSQISAAESSQNPQLRRESYLHYLKKTDDDKKAFKVRYQLAYMNYQHKNLTEAANSFKELSENKHGTPELRKKAADLSLDCLAQLKEDSKLQVWAWEFADSFPSYRTEFEGLARKALMNEVATVANNKSSSSSELKKALKKLLNTNLATASSEEKILFYNNQSVLARKLGETDVYLQAIRALLSLPSVADDRKNELREQLAGHYEKHLDFKNAYRYAVLGTSAQVSLHEREFRLGTLADLAELNPERHYRAALDAGLRGSRALILRSRLVLLSKNPIKELKLQAGELRKNSNLLNETVLLVYARTFNKQGLKSILEFKELRQKTASQFFARQDFYNKVASFRSRMASHEINTKTDRKIQRTLEERIKMAAQADKLLKESLALKDITAQMVMLNLITLENERLVRDLARLPMPKGLSTAEQNQYIALLKDKSKPFLIKAKTAKAKMEELWNQSPALKQLAHDYKMARPEIQALLLREIQILSELPGRGRMRSALSEAIAGSSFSAKDLASARRSVSENPANVRDLENLKFLETKMGHPLMPSYLEARLNQIHRGISL